MSWIIGYHGRSNETITKKIKHILPSNFIQAKSTSIEVYGGGLASTTFLKMSSDESRGLFVCGLGIKTEYGKTKFMDTSDWENIKLGKLDEIRKLNGHFAGVKWNPSSLKLFTDVLGLREMYLTSIHTAIVFSTRVDWLSQLRSDCDIDFEQFSTVWLSFNQLSHKSVVSHIERLGPGCIARLENGKIKYHRIAWLPEVSQPSSPEHLIEKIKKFTLFPLSNNRKISLGLSGGIDSRVVFSILSGQVREGWGLHAFGDPHHPDLQIAQKISEKFKLNLTPIYTEFPEADECVEMIKSHFGQNTIHIPASEILRLRWYIPLYKENKIVIDGGFGEIARRQYLNRLLLLGRKALKEKNSAKISKYLRHHRTAIFNSETMQIMEDGFQKQILALLKTMPDAATFGSENWLDLLAIRTRLANWNGFAQACIDGIAVNYMPFAQPELLTEVLNLPLKFRKNGRLWRKIIRTYQAELTHIPLVKGSTTYPFWLSTKGTMLWSIMKQKFGTVYQDQESARLIDHLQEFIRDTLYSQTVRTCPYYDYPALKNRVDSYFAGEKRYAREIDWWIAFELWRRTL